MFKVTRLPLLISPIYLFFILFTHLCSCQPKNEVLDIPESPFPIDQTSLSLDTLTEGFVIPYGLAILDEDHYLISDRIGKLYLYDQGKLREIKGVPKVTSFQDPGIPFILHGGLMDISLHPDYPDHPWIYMVYLADNVKCRVDRFRLEHNQVSGLETIFETRTAGYYGNGSRIVWQDEDHFFLNIGGATFSTRNNPILIAQDLEQDWGKIHRLMADGSIPNDNPILTGYAEPLSIWSYGHRDAQGLYFDTSSQTLFACEHGPLGGGEFNIIVKGGNYGWPLFSYGIDYTGKPVSTISEDSAAQITILPEHHWTIPEGTGGQCIAPACLLKADHSNISNWNEHFLIGSLTFRRLCIFDRTTKQTTGTTISGRVRTVKQLPGGDFLALVERNKLGISNGKIIRISGSSD